MRMRSFLAAAAVLVGLGSPAFSGDALKGPWDGFGVGTTATTKTTTKMSMEGVPEQTSQSRQTLVKVTDEAYVVKMEQEAGGTWTGQDVTLPRKATGEAGPVEGTKPEDLGEEKVTVDGQAMSCKKQRTVANGATTITWSHEKLGTLKMESTGPGDAKTTMEVTHLAAKEKIAGQDLECRRQVTTMKGTGFESTTTMWYCEKVPGGMAKMEATTVAGGMTTKVTSEVTSFEVK